MTEIRQSRRIVTGHDPAGRSVIKIDDRGAHGLGNLSELWVTDATPADNRGEAHVEWIHGVSPRVSLSSAGRRTR